MPFHCHAMPVHFHGNTCTRCTRFLTTADHPCKPCRTMFKVPHRHKASLNPLLKANFSSVVTSTLCLSPPLAPQVIDFRYTLHKASRLSTSLRTTAFVTYAFIPFGVMPFHCHAMPVHFHGNACARGTRFLTTAGHPCKPCRTTVNFPNPSWLVSNAPQSSLPSLRLHVSICSVCIPRGLILVGSLSAPLTLCSNLLMPRGS